MKAISCLIVLISVCPLFAQKIIKEKIPKGLEGSGSFVETQLSKDTVWFIGAGSVFLITSSNIDVIEETVYLRYNEINHVNNLQIVKGQWSKQDPNVPDEKEFVKSTKAIKAWTIQVIQRKYPDYYNKWFKK